MGIPMTLIEEVTILKFVNFAEIRIEKSTNSKGLKSYICFYYYKNELIDECDEKFNLGIKWTKIYTSSSKAKSDSLEIMAKIVEKLEV